MWQDDRSGIDRVGVVLFVRPLQMDRIGDIAYARYLSLMLCKLENVIQHYHKSTSVHRRGVLDAEDVVYLVSDI